MASEIFQYGRDLDKIMIYTKELIAVFGEHQRRYRFHGVPFLNTQQFVIDFAQLIDYMKKAALYSVRLVSLNDLTDLRREIRRFKEKTMNDDINSLELKAQLKDYLDNTFVQRLPELLNSFFGEDQSVSTPHMLHLESAWNCMPLDNLREYTRSGMDQQTFEEHLSNILGAVQRDLVQTDYLTLGLNELKGTVYRACRKFFNIEEKEYVEFLEELEEFRMESKAYLDAVEKYIDGVSDMWRNALTDPLAHPNPPTELHKRLQKTRDGLYAHFLDLFVIYLVTLAYFITHPSFSVLSSDNRPTTRSDVFSSRGDGLNRSFLDNFDEQNLPYGLILDPVKEYYRRKSVSSLFLKKQTLPVGLDGNPFAENLQLYLKIRGFGVNPTSFDTEELIRAKISRQKKNIFDFQPVSRAFISREAGKIHQQLKSSALYRQLYTPDRASIAILRKISAVVFRENQKYYEAAIRRLRWMEGRVCMAGVCTMYEEVFGAFYALFCPLLEM